MPKWALYGLAAIADFAFAAWFYSRGRLVLPAILTLAGICFVMATIGVVMKKDKRV